MISSVVQTPGTTPGRHAANCGPRSHAESGTPEDALLAAHNAKPSVAVVQWFGRARFKTRPSPDGSRRTAGLRWTGHRMVKSGPARCHRLAESEPSPFQAFSLGHRITTPPRTRGSQSSCGTPRLEKRHTRGRAAKKHRHRMLGTRRSMSRVEKTKRENACVDLRSS